MTHTTERDPIVKATLSVVQAFHELRLLTPMIPELQQKFDPLAEAIRKLTEEVAQTWPEHTEHAPNRKSEATGGRWRRSRGVTRYKPRPIPRGWRGVFSGVV